MIHKGSFTVVLDACVLYPFSLRDILLRLAELVLNRPKWTDEINQEWVSNLSKEQGIDEASLERTVRLMNTAFPEAIVTGYSSLIQGVELPDPDDRHVLAAAIRASADLIVTNNIKDFPEEELDKFDIEAQTADIFIHNLIDLDPQRCCEALRNLLNDLTDPPLNQKELLKRFRKVGLKQSSKLFEKNC